MNPPFIKRDHKCAARLFVEKCFAQHLHEGGEMLCVMPRTFLRATRSVSLLRRMCAQGTFTHFWFPENEHMFANATIDIVIWRYVLSGSAPECSIARGSDWSTERPGTYRLAESGLVIENTRDGSPRMSIGSQFHVIVGQVSGLDAVFRHANGNLDLLCGKDTVHKFIHVPSGEVLDPHNELHAHLIAHKEQLIARKIRAFTEDNWFEWGGMAKCAHCYGLLRTPLYLYQMSLSTVRKCDRRVYGARSILQRVIDMHHTKKY